MTELLSLAEAQAQVLDHVQPLPAEPVEPAAAVGRFLAEDARATVDLPPFASSAMDGYAVRADDTPGRLPVAAKIAAGSPAAGGLARGEAMAIATGGGVPRGGGAVVPLEDVFTPYKEIEISGA